MTNRAAHIRIAVDIGGTFTDLQGLDERTGGFMNLKVPTTPVDGGAGNSRERPTALRRRDRKLGYTA